MVVNMKNFIHVFWIWIFLQIQLSNSEIRYCPEAVASVKTVSSCPDSKEAWDIAARKKNCSGMAAGQTCSTVEKFQYHCVINGFRNKFVEVCAPKRIIFGHCVEFNSGGGVIQDQMSATCNSNFPKCDSIYHSTDAYKYPDCYDLVSRSKIKPSTTTDSTTTVEEPDIGQEHVNGTIIGIILAVVLVVTTGVVVVVVVLKFKRISRRLNTIPTEGEVTRLMSSVAVNEQDCSDKENEDTVDNYHLQYKISKPIRRKHSSHSESSANNYIEVKQKVLKEDESKETWDDNKFGGTTTTYRRRRTTSLSTDDDTTYSDDQFEEMEKFPYYAPKVLRSYGHKRTSSLPYVRDLDKNIKKETIRTEKHDHTRIHKNV